MKQRFLHVVLFATLLSASCWAAEIGIYFDTAATVNCLPEVATFPYVTQAYIIATGCAGSGGVRGWEAGVAWDSTLVVNPVNVSGQPLNMRAFPEYMVGLGSALPDSDTVVLAQLSVRAFGPGGLFIHGLGISAPDSMPAIDFEDVEGPQTLMYAYGGRDAQVASIGLIACPEVPVVATQLVRAVALRSGTITFHTSPGPEVLARKSMEVYDGGSTSDVGFTGTIVSAELKCVDFLTGAIPGISGDAATVLELVVEVTDKYWGQVPAVTTVLVLGYELAGCTRCAQNWDLPSIESVLPQAECFVAARDEGGTYLVTHWESFSIVESAKFADERRKSLSRFDQYSDREQMNAAVIVVDAELMTATISSANYRVVRRIKGDVGDVVTVAAHGESIDMGARGDLTRLYLAKDDSGLYPLHGHYSVQKIGGGRQ